MQLIKANVEWRLLLFLSCLIVLICWRLFVMWSHGIFCTEVKGIRRLLFRYSCRKVGSNVQQFEFSWMKRAILSVLVLLILYAYWWEVHIFTCVNMIVYVPWEHVWMLEGNLRCSWISFCTFKLGSIVFSPYVPQAEWPVCFWRFFCLCLPSSLRSTKSRDKYTTVVKFMCILRIQTQVLTFIGSVVCTEPPLPCPPPAPATVLPKEHSLWSIHVLGKNLSWPGHIVAGR